VSVPHRNDSREEHGRICRLLPARPTESEGPVGPTVCKHNTRRPLLVREHALQQRIRYDVQPEVHQMGDKVWQLPKEQFIAIWNASETLTEAAKRIKQTVSGPAPRWAVIARAGQLRHEGIELKPLPTTASAA